MKIKRYQFGFEEDGKVWRKRDFWNEFEGTRSMFESCWRGFRKSGWCYESVDEIQGILDQLASEKVNNPDSPFYIFG